MTQTAPAPETAAGTELAPVSAAKRVLARPGVSLLDVLTAIAGADVAKAPPAELNKPTAATVTLPKPIKVSEELRAAIEDFVAAAEAAKNDVPTTRKRLTKDQRNKLGRVYKNAKRIKTDVEKLITDTIRTAFFNHFDVTAEGTEGFDADATLVDGKGFYLAAAEDEVPDVGAVKREVRAGTPSVDLTVIATAIKEGRLPASAVNGITRSTRVMDDEKAVRWFAKNPQYAAVLAEATVVSGASGSLNLR